METKQINDIQNDLVGMDLDKMFGDLEIAAAGVADNNEDIFNNLQLDETIKEPVKADTETAAGQQIGNQENQPDKAVQTKNENITKIKEEAKEDANNREVVEEPVKEKKTRKKATRRKFSKQTDKEAETVDEEADNVSTITLPLTDKVDIEKMLENVPVIPISAAQEKHTKFDDMISKIQIRKDLDKANAADLLDKLDELNDLVYPEYTFYRTYADNLYRNNSSLFDVLRTTHAFGPNTSARKGSAFKAMIEYTDSTTKKKTNLIHLMWAIHAEINYYEDMLNRLENKRRILNQQIDLLTH